MVYNRFIYRYALFVVLSLCEVLSAASGTAQEAKKEPKQAQHTSDKQASQDKKEVKAKPAKSPVVKRKIKPRREAPVKAPPTAAKSIAKPKVAKTTPKPKGVKPVKAATAKTRALSKSKQAARENKAAGTDKVKTTQTEKTKVVAGTAESEKKIEAKKPVRITLQQAKALLASAESDKVRQGLEHLKAIGKPTITAPIVARLQQGLPPALVVLAIDALVKAKNALAAQVLIELCEHRRALIRTSAISALGSLKIRKAYTVVREAIDDSDQTVRSTATKVLSQLGGRKSLNDLYRVFEGGDTDVVPEIAKWVTTRDTDRLTGYLKDHSFSTLKPAFVEILNKRRASVREKTNLIARLGEVGTPEIQQFLRDYMNDLPNAGRKPLTNAIAKALQNGKEPETAEPEPKAKPNKTSALKRAEAK